MALRYTFSTKRKSFSSYASYLSIGGLSIGVAALMLTASIIDGFEGVLSEKLSSFQGYGRITHIFAKPMNKKDISFTEADRKYNNLEPFITSFCIARSGGLAEGMLIEGIESLPKSIANNDFNKINAGEIIIGGGLSENLQCNIGDNIYLQPFENKKISRINKVRTFKVKHIFNSGIQEFDNLLGYININDAAGLFNFKPNYVSGFIIKKGENIDFINEIQYPYYFESWRDKHSLLFEWISVQRIPAYIMFGLIALVGLVNVLAALTMIIIEKSRQIGIFISQGIQKRQLNLIFMIQSGIIGLLGCALGGLGSLIIILIQTRFQILKIPTDIYFMDQIPFSFHYTSFWIILITIVVFCILSSLWPIRIAANISPAKVLKYE